MPHTEEAACRVSIIIPHYNQKECLKTLLPSVANQTFKDFEVIIIDDCTPGESVIDYITNLIRQYDNMRLLQNTINMRFVKTCNRGIQLAKGEYVCFLNSDTEVRDNFVERNVDILDADASIGALSCIVVDQHGQNWFSGGFYRSGAPVNLKDDFQGVRSVDFVAGTAAFYRREIFQKIGLLDDTYVMYHEDVEFGLRMRTKSSLRACVFPEKLVIHYIVASIPGPDIWYYNCRNRMLLSRTYSPKHVPGTVVYSMFYATYFLVRSVISMLFIHPQISQYYRHRARAAARGAFHGLLTKRRYG
jgi:GT2 family glycosyltransferase